MKLKISIHDGVTYLHNATLWNDAAQTLLEIDAEMLRTMWQACDGGQGAKELLKKLNANVEKQYLFVLTYNAWKPDPKSLDSAVLQFQINSVEERAMNA